MADAAEILGTKPPQTGTAALVASSDDGDPKGNYQRNKAWLKPGAATFVTPLPPDQEAQFQAWVKANNIPFQDTETADYDMRGYWKASQDPSAWQALQQSGKLPPDMAPAGTKVDPNDGKPHFPDYWKTPYHETFSNESQWADPAAAPHWTDDDKLVTPDGNVLFDDRAQKSEEDAPAPVPPSAHDELAGIFGMKPAALQMFGAPQSGTAALGTPPTLAQGWQANANLYSDWVQQQQQQAIQQGLVDPQTGEMTERGRQQQAAAAMFGMLGSTSAPGSGTTQIAGTAPMYRKAIEHLMTQMPHAKSVLDYGAGMGLGADAMRQYLGERATVHTLEPNPERWRGQHPPTYTDDSQIKQPYDLILNTNVLNVLPADIRKDVVKDIGNRLAPGGKALITTRGWSGDVAATKGAEPGDEPNSIYVKRGEQRVFQKGFDAAELRQYVAEVLGDGYTVQPASGFGKAGVMVTREQAPAAR